MTGEKQLPYRLLVLDLDGTALSRDPAVFAPGVLDAAKQASARGAEVVFATGRPYPHLPPEVRPGALPWLRYLVLNDGAQVLDRRTGKCLWLQTVDAAALEQIAAVSQREDVLVEYIDAAGVYHVPETALKILLETAPVSAFHRNILCTSARPFAGGPARFAAESIVKINMPCVPADRWERVCAALEKAGVLPMECCPGALEITSVRAGKQQAVAFLAGKIGLSLADVMALGDSGNDAALLRSAGLGVAMGNASLPAKQAADVLTAPNDEGGAAMAIHKWLLHDGVPSTL